MQSNPGCGGGNLSGTELPPAVAVAYDPSVPPHLDRNEILAATEHDKKNTGSSRVMVFPRRVGECVVVSDVTEEEIAYGIDAVLRFF